MYEQYETLNIVLWFCHVCNCFPDRYFWLGASDKAEEGNWAWNSGAPWDFEDWMNDQPDDYMGENCLHAYSRSWGIGWNDWSCDKSGAYLCEKDAEGLNPLNYFVINFQF